MNTAAGNLVGREPEMLRLRQALEHASASHGHVVVVSGEPGIGKTRLVEELLGDARQRGYTVLTSSAHPLQRHLVLAPVLEAISLHLGSLTVSARAHLLPPGDALHHLLTIAHHDPAPTGDQALERSTIFAAAARLVARLAARHPLVFHLDDAQWADDETIEFLQYVSTRIATLPALILVTLRRNSHGAVAEFAAGIRRSARDTEIAVGPLDEAPLLSLLAERNPALTDVSLRAVAELSAGVPFFAIALADKNQPRSAQHAAPLIIVELIHDALSGLTPHERMLLEILAVAGNSGTDVLMRSLWQGADDPRKQALATLRARGCVAEAVRGHERFYRLTHPLYAQVLYADIEPERRAQLHGAAARVLSRSVDPPVLELAPHFRHGGGHVDEHRAVTVLAAAATLSLQVHDYAAVIDYALNALARSGPTICPELTPGLTETAGEAQLRSGRVDLAVDIWTAGFRNHSPTSFSLPQALHGRIALVESDRGNYAESSRRMYLATSSASAGAAPPRSAPQRAEDAVMRLFWMTRQGDPRLMGHVADELCECGHLSVTPEARAAGGLGLMIKSELAGELSNARSQGEQALVAAMNCEHDVFQGAILRELVRIATLLGDLPGASAHGAAATSLLATIGRWGPESSSRGNQSLVSILAGDLNAARRLADASESSARASGSPRPMARSILLHALLNAEQGRSRAAHADLGEADRTCGTLISGDSGLNLLAECARAVLALDEGAPFLPAPGRRTDFHSDAVLQLIHPLLAGRLALRAGDVDGVHLRAGLLRELGSMSPPGRALADRLDGLLLRQRGHGEQAAELLASSAAGLESCGMMLLGAQTQLEWAEVAAEQGQPGAGSALTAALGVFTTESAMHWIDRARRLGRSIGVHTGIRRPMVGSLSQREYEVATLVAEGLNNAGIAARLYLSDRTVETHMRNIYAHLGLGSRVDVARWAAAHRTAAALPSAEQPGP